MALVVEIDEQLLAAKFCPLLPHLDERQRRLTLAAEARSLGTVGSAWLRGCWGISQDGSGRGGLGEEPWAGPGEVGEVVSRWLNSPLAFSMRWMTWCRDPWRPDDPAALDYRVDPQPGRWAGQARSPGVVSQGSGTPSAPLQPTRRHVVNSRALTCQRNCVAALMLTCERARRRHATTAEPAFLLVGALRAKSQHALQYCATSLIGCASPGS
jgi:hypothetical protein